MTPPISGSRLLHELEMHVSVALWAALNVPVLNQVSGINQAPGGGMEMPGMCIEVGGFAKLKVEQRRGSGQRCDIVGLIQVVAVVIGTQLGADQVEHR